MASVSFQPIISRDETNKELTALQDQLDKQSDAITSLKNRVEQLEEDKNWDTSYTKRAFQTAFTFGVTLPIYYFLLDSENFISDPLVPSTAFIISTLALTCLRPCGFVEKAIMDRLSNLSSQRAPRPADEAV